jgi:uncharacterized protein with von Willebrand factor type A (vWA) domain
MVNNYIIMIDNSYSMGGHMYKVVNGLNTFLYKLKTNKDKTYLTVITFNSNIHYIVKYADVNILEEFKLNQFIVNGTTALYDSICDVISTNNFLLTNKINLIIISDGDDNISTVYNKEKTNQICNEAIKSGNWNIVHCNLEEIILDIPTITYELDDISDIFNKLNI